MVEVVGRFALFESVGVSSRNVTGIQQLRRIDKLNRDREVAQASEHGRDRMTPHTDSSVHQQSLHRFLGGLLGGEAGPFPELVPDVQLGTAQIPLGLFVPVPIAVHGQILAGLVLHSEPPRLLPAFPEATTPAAGQAGMLPLGPGTLRICTGNVLSGQRDKRILLGFRLEVVFGHLFDQLVECVVVLVRLDLLKDPEDARVALE